MILYNRGMGISFKNAVMISIVIHAAVMLSLYRAPAFKTEQVRRDNVMVDYIPAEEPKKTDTSSREVKAVSVETPKVELPPKVEVKPIADAAPEADAVKQKEISDALARKQAEIRSTKDYINYYQLIREKIRSRLKDNYRPQFGEGDVSLLFVLASNGSLVSSDVDLPSSSPKRLLRNIALMSLKDSAPFEPFPKAVSLPKMSFTVTVTFKKQ